MLAMPKWTFSMDAPLKDAQVQVSDETGADVPVETTWQPAGQLNHQTLIFKPTALLAKKSKGTTWQVKITLKNKKAYSYSVTLI
jgi:hypothetical protein